MQAGGVTTTDTYQVSGRVLIDGVDIGASVESVSLGRDIPSGLPGDGGFTSATGKVTATWGDEVTDRVDHPWTPNPVWPPRPNAQVEVLLADGTGEWTMFKGVVTQPSGSTATRTISFGVRDNYRSLDTLVTIPSLANRMPHLSDGNHYRYIGMQSAFLTDMLLRAGERYCTPPRQTGDVVGVTFMGSTWPERGTNIESSKETPDGISVVFPNWVTTDYGLAVHNVSAEYTPQLWSGTPGDGRLTEHPVEITQEILPDSGEPTYLRARFANGGRVALVHYNDAVRATYYTPGGTPNTLLQAPSTGKQRVTVRFWLESTTLHVEMRTLTNQGDVIVEGTASRGVSTALNGQIDHVWAHGEGAQGAFQVAFPPTPFTALAHRRNAVIHAAGGGRNLLTGVPPQINANVLDLLNDQADAEFAQWWIDEHDILQWWDRGLLAQRPVVGELTGADHVKNLSWENDHDAARHRINVKYQQPQVTQRWRTNLTLWQGGSNTLQEGDEDETFVNVPNDEIWLGVHWENPYRYAPGQSSFWPRRGIGTVVGGVAIDTDGNERMTASIGVTLRKITDEAYVFETNVTALGTDEQAALQFPDDRETDTSLWARWRGEKLPLLRGKMRVKFQDETYTSEITGDASAPDYTHDYGWWLQDIGYVGRTADYAAASLTQPRPKITGLDIMPVLALQVGDHIRITMPDVAELELTGVVTSNNLDADLAAGVISQSISIMPTNVESLARQWSDFGTVYGEAAWHDWAQTTANNTWSDFGTTPLD